MSAVATIRRRPSPLLMLLCLVFAGVLTAQGVGKGDRVLIYIPMIPEAAIAMLACARIGAVHSVVFGGFAAKELSVRIDDARPKVIVSASCGIEVAQVIPYKPLLDKAIDMAEFKPGACIVKQRPMEAAAMTEGRDLDWDEVMQDARPHETAGVDRTVALDDGLRSAGIDVSGSG